MLAACRIGVRRPLRGSLLAPRPAAAAPRRLLSAAGGAGAGRESGDASSSSSSSSSSRGSGGGGSRGGGGGGGSSSSDEDARGKVDASRDRPTFASASNNNQAWLEAPKHVKDAIAAAQVHVDIRERLTEETLREIPLDKIRNFSIIAHVDHGKSTLADKLLEAAGNVDLSQSGRQVLDDLKVEKERGITVKARTASMLFRGHLINLVDTPGHVDFELEVKRSLSSCQGALLLIDSSQGVQAQTIANYRSAQAVGLTVIPVLTKLDLPHSDPAKALDQIERLFGIAEEQVIWTSAKTGEGCDLLLPAIIERVPPPPLVRAPYLAGAKFRARVADSWYDRYRGTICLITVDYGEMSLGDSFFTDTTPAGRPFEVLELGQLLPQPEPRSFLKAGMVGYMAAGIKERSVVTVGDFICDSAEALHAHRRSGEHALLAVAASPKVYASVYSVDSGDFDELRKSLERLTLNDASVHMKPEMSGALGAGFRLGFLGRLHMEVFFQRLHDEFETDIIATAPTVPYWAVLKDGSVVTAETPAQLPCMSTGKVDHYLEQMALVTVLTPVEHMGPVIAACKERRGRQTELLHLDEGKIVIKYMMPWQELIIDLHDEIKSVSSGFASFDYVEAGTEKSKVGKVDMLLNGKPVDALTFVCHQSVQHERGKEVCAKLRENIKRQQYEVVIQAAVGGKIVARERIAPVRKDVLTKSGKTVGGGDMSRKQKLLNKQKEGKKRMKSVGNVELDQEAFWSVLRR